MAFLLANMPAIKLLSEQQKAFEVWLFAETYMIGFITVGNIIFLLLRSGCSKQLKQPITFDERLGDKSKDNLGCESTDFMLSTFNTMVCFIGTNILFLSSPITAVENTTEQSRKVIGGHLIFQVIQMVLFLAFSLIPDRTLYNYKKCVMKSKRWLMYFFLLFIPLLSFALDLFWCIEYEKDIYGEKNILRAWNLVYPLSGFF